MRTIPLHEKSLAFNWSGSWIMLLIDWRNLQILRRHIWSVTNSTLFGNSKTPAASQSSFFIGQLYSTLIFYVCKNRRINLSYQRTSRIKSKEFEYIHLKSEEPLKN